MTVKVYVPLSTPEIVVVAPLPWMEALSGVLLSVQVPVEGSPVTAMLPVEDVHVG